jgi:hypothetical protein
LLHISAVFCRHDEFKLNSANQKEFINLTGTDESIDREEREYPARLQEGAVMTISRTYYRNRCITFGPQIILRELIELTGVDASLEVFSTEDVKGPTYTGRIRNMKIAALNRSFTYSGDVKARGDTEIEVYYLLLNSLLFPGVIATKDFKKKPEVKEYLSVIDRKGKPRMFLIKDDPVQPVPIIKKRGHLGLVKLPRVNVVAAPS